MLRTVLFTSITTLLLTIATSTPASAIPICPSGTMADYIGFGATGCQFNSLTFSNFSYEGTVGTFQAPIGLVPVVPQPSPSEVSVQPRSDPASLGSGGAGLTFSSPPSFWGRVDLSFDVAGPGIVRDDLSASLLTLADLLSPSVLEFANPPGVSASVAFPHHCQFPNLSDPRFDPAECLNAESPKAISLAAAIPFQHINIHGEDERIIQASFATPEPTTLLLWGTTAAGMGLAARRRRRRQR